MLRYLILEPRDGYRWDVGHPLNQPYIFFDIQIATYSSVDQSVEHLKNYLYGKKKDNYESPIREEISGGYIVTLSDQAETEWQFFIAEVRHNDNE